MPAFVSAVARLKVCFSRFHPPTNIAKPLTAGQNGPAAYAQLILAAKTGGADPADFGGTDLVKRLTATGPAPVTASSSQDDSGTSVWWMVGAGLAAGAGIGFLLSSRNKRKQP